MSLIGLLVTLLVLAIVIYVVNLILGMLTLPPQVKTIIFIIVGLIFLVYLLAQIGVLGGATGNPSLHL